MKRIFAKIVELDKATIEWAKERGASEYQVNGLRLLEGFIIAAIIL